MIAENCISLCPALGIEGGATKTIALLSNGRRYVFGPLNLKLASDRQILAVLRQFKPAQASICLAGCRTEPDRARLRQLACQAWGRIPVFVGNDLDSGHAAAFGANGTGILVISGTGSCVFGRNGTRTARAGGWGHLLGDHGSGYALAISNLKSQISIFDRTGRIGAPLRRVLKRLCLHSPDQLVEWIQHAGKDEIAALLPEVIHAVPSVLEEAAGQLAADCAVVAKRLRLHAPSVALSGGVFAHHAGFARLTARKIRQLLPRSRIRRLRRDPAYGALLLASPRETFTIVNRMFTIVNIPETEKRNLRTMDLDRRTVPELVETMLAEEACVVPAVRAGQSAIVRAIRAIVAAFRRGGRLFYVGAGTSGRLGTLDASECPPTFSTDPSMVQAIMAGGLEALHRSVEGAEDDRKAGAKAVRQRRVGQRDVVVGIAASGRTPFVLGALDEARHRGARTFLLCFSSPVRPFPHSPIIISTGPEVLTGSTRLKAGTATKIVLNMLTTISMIRLGKVMGNLMVDVRPTNAKLRSRACRIVAALRGCDEEEAQRRLVCTGWNIKRAVRK